MFKNKFNLLLTKKNKPKYNYFVNMLIKQQNNLKKKKKFFDIFTHWYSNNFINIHEKNKKKDINYFKYNLNLFVNQDHNNLSKLVTYKFLYNSNINISFLFSNQYLLKLTPNNILNNYWYINKNFFFLNIKNINFLKYYKKYQLTNRITFKYLYFIDKNINLCTGLIPFNLKYKPKNKATKNIFYLYNCFTLLNGNILNSNICNNIKSYDYLLINNYNVDVSYLKNQITNKLSKLNIKKNFLNIEFLNFQQECVVINKTWNNVSFIYYSIYIKFYLYAYKNIFVNIFFFNCKNNLQYLYFYYYSNFNVLVKTLFNPNYFIYADKNIYYLFFRKYFNFDDSLLIDSCYNFNSKKKKKFIIINSHKKVFKNLNTKYKNQTYKLLLAKYKKLLLAKYKKLLLAKYKNKAYSKKYIFYKYNLFRQKKPIMLKKQFMKIIANRARRTTHAQLTKKYKKFLKYNLNKKYFYNVFYKNSFIRFLNKPSLCKSIKVYNWSANILNFQFNVNMLIFKPLFYYSFGGIFKSVFINNIRFNRHYIFSNNTDVLDAIFFKINYLQNNFNMTTWNLLMNEQSYKKYLFRNLLKKKKRQKIKFFLFKNKRFKKKKLLIKTRILKKLKAKKLWNIVKIRKIVKIPLFLRYVKTFKKAQSFKYIKSLNKTKIIFKKPIHRIMPYLYKKSYKLWFNFYQLKCLDKYLSTLIYAINFLKFFFYKNTLNLFHISFFKKKYILKYFKKNFNLFNFFILKLNKPYRFSSIFNYITPKYISKFSFFLVKNKFFFNHKKKIIDNVVFFFVKKKNINTVNYKFLKMFFRYKKKLYFNYKVLFFIKYILLPDKDYLTFYINNLFKVFNNNIKNKILKNDKVSFNFNISSSNLKHYFY